jgi:hypothetical protein
MGKGGAISDREENGMGEKLRKIREMEGEW